MKKCPLLGKKCIQEQCEWWIHLLGSNPQTGQPTDEYGCTLRWLPILLTENANQIRQTAASVDKVATQVNKHRGAFIAALNPAAQERVLSAPKLIE